MPQPVSFNTGTPVSGSIQENSISYVVDGQQRDYRGGYSGLAWMSEAPATNNVIFIGNSNNVGRGPANKPLFYPSFNNSDANIIYAANKLPSSPGTFNTTTDAYDWAIGNNFFINNSNNPIPRIDADGLIFYVDANQPGSYPGINNTGYDISGNGNNGDLLNGTNWNSGGWFEFDGADDRIRTLFGLQNNNESHEAWIYSKGNVSTYNMFLGIILPYYGFFTGNTFIVQDYVGGNQVGYYTGTLSLNRWYHFLSTRNYDGTNTTLTTYINGTLSAQQTYSGAPSNAGGTWAIGNWDAPSAGASYPFYGDISGVKIYTQTLTEAQVKQNYFQSNIVTNGLIFMVDANNLVSYPKSNSNWYTLTGSINGTLVNSSTFNQENGGVIVFDGVDDYFRTSALFTNARTNITMAGWIYVNLGTTGTFLSNGDDSGGYCIGIGQYFSTADNQIVGLFGTIRWILTGAYYQYTGWHHVAMTLDGSGTPSIYVNGVLIGTYPGSIANIPSPGTGFAIASQWGIRFANMKCGNSNFYNRELTAAEIQQNYQATKDKFLGQDIVTSGLAMYLDATNKDSYPGTGDTWYDVSGNSKNAVMSTTNPPVFKTLNGIQCFQTSDLSNQNFSVSNYTFSTTGRTYELWINQTTVSIGYQTWTDDNLTERVLFGLYNSDFFIYPSLQQPGAISAGQWTYVAYTLAGDIGSTAIGYKNGTAIISGTYGYSLASGVGTLYLMGDAGGEGMDGYCALARTYNRVLTPTEIQQNYNAQKIRFGL
jgi:hypothetical protein